MFRPSGVCWAFQPGGGAVTGRVDSEGQFTGEGLAYVYPDYRTLLVGSFRDGLLICGQEATITSLRMEQVPHFLPATLSLVSLPDHDFSL